MARLTEYATRGLLQVGGALGKNGGLVGHLGGLAREGGEARRSHHVGLVGVQGCGGDQFLGAITHHVRGLLQRRALGLPALGEAKQTRGLDLGLVQ